MLEEFELGLEEVWKRECSGDSDVDKVSKGAIHEPPKPLFICKYDAVHCGI